MNNTHTPLLVSEYIPAGRMNVRLPRKGWWHKHPWRRKKPGCCI